MRWSADVTSAAFSPDGSKIATPSREDIATVDPDDGRVTQGSRAYSATVLDAKTGANLILLAGHKNTVTSVAWSPDGTRIVTASWDNTAKVWDINKGNKVHALKEDYRTVVTFAGGTEVFTLKGHTGHLSSAAFSPDGTRIVTTSWDNTAKVWDASTGAELLTFKGHTNQVMWAAWSPDGSRVLTTGYDHVGRIWDPTSGEELKALRWCLGEGAWSPDGSKVVTGTHGPFAEVWDVETGEVRLKLKGHTGDVMAVAWSPDGKRILTGSYDKTAKLWDAKTGAEVMTLKGHTYWVGSVAWSRDGSRIVTGGGHDHTVRVWDATPISREYLLK
jgi:WD40 repeat protein